MVNYGIVNENKRRKIKILVNIRIIVNIYEYSMWNFTIDCQS